MFITNASFRSEISDTLCEPDDQYWLAVELLMHKHWFVVTIRQMELIDGKRVPVRLRNILLANVSDIERLAQQDNEALTQFESAMIMIPVRHNGTGTWKMEPLVAVWVADEPEAPGKIVEIYETQSGAKFLTAFSTASLDELKNQTLRYRFPVQGGKQ